MVSIGISKLSLSDLVFVDPWVAGATYYRDMVLSQHLLPVMGDASGDFFVFQ